MYEGTHMCEVDKFGVVQVIWCPLLEAKRALREQREVTLRIWTGTRSEKVL